MEHTWRSKGDVKDVKLKGLNKERQQGEPNWPLQLQPSN